MAIEALERRVGADGSLRHVCCAWRNKVRKTPRERIEIRVGDKVVTAGRDANRGGKEE